MPVMIEAVGTVEPEHSVQVRAQVSGVLKSVQFKEGDPVKPGQVLFRIDSRPMTGKRTTRRSRRSRATRRSSRRRRAQQERLRPLLEQGVHHARGIRRRRHPEQVAARRPWRPTGAPLSRRASSWAMPRIVAPISGRTGSLSVKPGNLVAAGTGGAPLVVDQQDGPILVAFSIPERQLDAIRRGVDGRRAEGRRSVRHRNAPAGG